MIAQPPPPPVIAVECEGPLWRLSSSDGLLSGAFRDRRSAVRCAHEEIERHPGYIVVVREL